MKKGINEFEDTAASDPRYAMAPKKAPAHNIEKWVSFSWLAELLVLAASREKKASPSPNETKKLAAAKSRQT